MLLLTLLALPALADAFTFTLGAPPAQCSNLTLNWSGGTAPYELTVLPLGEISGPEIRTLLDTNTSSTSWSQPLVLPQGSTFVLVLSDATGYGTGGTSSVLTVGNGDSSCLPTTPSSSPFLFSMQPEVPGQCSSVQFSWDDGTPQGQAVISGVIPGGESFQLLAAAGGQQWTADVPQGTQIAFIVGDERGRGKGGSSDLMTVGGGSASCLNGNSPSSTQGPAAGQVSTAAPASSSSSSSSSPPSSSSGSGSGSGSDSSGSSTSSSSTLPPGSGGGTVTGSPIATGAGGSGQQGSSSGSSSSSSSSSHTGAIAGGVVGGVVALLLLLLLVFCLTRRRRRAARAREGQGEKLGRTDLLDPAPARGAAASSSGGRGRWYEQEAFVPPLTLAGAASSRGTPSSAYATEGPVSSRGRTGTATATVTGTDPSDAASPTTTGFPAGRPNTAGDAALAAAAAAADPKKRVPQGERGERRRTVNWVQHDDAGAVLPEPEPEPELEGPPPGIDIGEGAEQVTVDVPPSYEALQQGQGQGRGGPV
ncbi:hypothetical protein CALCODRAFT_71571 [Calocera cornea HHB12733]|uniref:Mid2 domain-containing protein n=1 Tax=Calocera cornea HHB12733 TaxID=1353952 RepID=A0A165IS86_9BASI|nr:hypothetical protein CALCODRAFT_71571 [Calocera cornea HHB12733]